MPDAASHPPLVLLANAQEWFSRSLESILRPAGYAVLKVYTASDAMETARRTLPDVLILDTELPDAQPDWVGGAKLVRSWGLNAVAERLEGRAQSTS